MADAFSPKGLAYIAAADELYSAVAEILDTGDGPPDYARLEDAARAFAKASNEWEDHPLKVESTGCLFCDLDLAPQHLAGVAVHMHKRTKVLCTRRGEV